MMDRSAAPCVHHHCGETNERLNSRSLDCDPQLLLVIVLATPSTRPAQPAATRRHGRTATDAVDEQSDRLWVLLSSVGGAHRDGRLIVDAAVILLALPASGVVVFKHTPPTALVALGDCAPPATRRRGMPVLGALRGHDGRARRVEDAVGGLLVQERRGPEDRGPGGESGVPVWMGLVEDGMRRGGRGGLGRRRHGWREGHLCRVLTGWLAVWLAGWLSGWLAGAELVSLEVRGCRRGG